MSIVDKLQRQINMIFRGNLNASSSMYGYQAIFEDWIAQAKIEGSGLEGGPCVINMDNYASTICDQLWPFVSKIIHELVRMMTPLLKLAGVEEKNMSPFWSLSSLSLDFSTSVVPSIPSYEIVLVSI